MEESYKNMVWILIELETKKNIQKVREISSEVLYFIHQHLLVQPLTQAENSFGETPGQASMQDLNTASGHPPG